MLTLTAPGFGRTHRVPSSASSRLRCGCGRIHGETDALIRGVPLDINEYDHQAQVLWNYHLGLLWDRSRQILRSHDPTVEFGSAREWQARGAIHMHVLLRGERRSAKDWLRLGTAVAGASARLPDGTSQRWGSHFDIGRVGFRQNEPESAVQAAGYVAKAITYLAKDIERAGRDPRSLMWPHWERLARAARELRCERCPDLNARRSSCPNPVHRRWGARSSVVSVSRASRDGLRPGWSLTGLTRTAQREARRAWHEDQVTFGDYALPFE